MPPKPNDRLARLQAGAKPVAPPPPPSASGGGSGGGVEVVAGGAGGGGDVDEPEKYVVGENDEIYSNMIVGNMLEANSFEFGADQWKQIAEDKSNKETALKIKAQGEEFSPDKKDVAVAGGVKENSAGLYKHQRNFITEEKMLISPNGEFQWDGYKNAYPPYNEGSKEMFVPADRIKLRTAAASYVLSSDAAFKRDDLVYINYRGKNIWYKGKISRDRGVCKSYNIVYDDGEEEKRTLHHLIRYPATAVASASANGGAAAETASPAEFKASDKVEINYRGTARWFKGTVKSVQEEHIYDVELDQSLTLTCQANINSKSFRSDKKSRISMTAEAMGDGYEGLLNQVKSGYKGLPNDLPLILCFKVREGGKEIKYILSDDAGDAEDGSNAADPTEQKMSVLKLEDGHTIWLEQDQKEIDKVEREEATLKSAEIEKKKDRSIRKNEIVDEAEKILKEREAKNTIKSSSKADEKKAVNAKDLAKNDASLFAITDCRITDHAKFKYPWSQLSYMTYWAAIVLNHVDGLYKTKSTNAIIDVKRKDLVDCLVSLQRAMKELEPVSPAALVEDATYISNVLVKVLTNAKQMDLPTIFMSEFPEIIERSAFDNISVKKLKLYTEQSQVLGLIYDHMTKLKTNSSLRTVMGYRVPPSGGKTMLSVAIAAMLRKNFGDSRKRLLYVCYNNLVRMAVANACEQTLVPYWVASTRVNPPRPGCEKSQINTSFTCRDNTRAAKQARRRQAETSKFEDKFGTIPSEWDKATKETVSQNYIIISDITSAIELLKLYGQDFIVYLDEPTAGAENGTFDNAIQEKVAELMTLLGRTSMTIMLSATLPNLHTEFPAVRTLWGAENVKMVETQRLPVGCVAIGPDGRNYLPHQISESPMEFKEAIRGLQNDALMLRFYTPLPVVRMSREIEKIVAERQIPMPNRLKFRSYLPNIGSISHRRIREYAQELLRFVIEYEGPAYDIINKLTGDVEGSNVEFHQEVFLVLKKLGLEDNIKAIPMTSDDFVENYIAQEGRALAVTTSSTSALKIRRGTEAGCCNCRHCVACEPKSAKEIDVVSEDLEALSAKAISRYIGKLKEEDKIKYHDGPYKYIQKFQEEWKRAEEKAASFLKAKDSKTKHEHSENRETRADLEAKIKDAVKFPVFEWPKIAGFSAVMTDDEVASLDPQYAALLLSGLGRYDPQKMKGLENHITMREAADGHVACLFSSPDIVYGTNMSLITVFIGSGYGFNATRNSLYQLIGRAGRTGRANKARILFEDFHTMKRALLPEPNGKNFEAEVMDLVLSRQVAERGAAAAFAAHVKP